MINQLSLSQLEHKAYAEDNQVALAILSKLDEEVDEAVEQAATVNDADYSYTIFDAVKTVQELLEVEWIKEETKDTISYLIKGLHEDTSPYNNHLVITRYKSSENYTLTVNGGQYGEDIQVEKFLAKGFKEAQTTAIKLTINLIKRGLELNYD